MKNPAELALRRPLVVVLLTLLCVCHGWLSFLDMPRQENPTLRPRHAQIDVMLPGAEPAKVERLVTRVLEAKVAEVDDIEDMFAVSSRGRASMIVELEKSAPLEQRLQEIREKARAAREQMPSSASEPEVETDVLRTHTMILALTLDRPLPPGRRGPSLTLRRLARQLQRELEALPLMRSVSLDGLPQEEIEIAVDLRRLSQRGLSVEALIDAVARRNIALPSGELELGGARSSVETSGLYDGLDAIAASPLASGNGAPSVRVADVARVERHLAQEAVVVRHRGAPAVTLALEMLDGRNALAFGDTVRGWMQEREASLPPGFRIAVVADEPTYVRDRLDRLFGSLQLGMLLVVGVTFLGMGWRAGTAVSISIPITLLVAFGFMGVWGVVLEQLSIAALVIGIGLVVDEAIVVSDNIQRHIDLGTSPREAAVRGLEEIHLAVLAGAATTIAAFIPLFLMQGDVGDFIRGIPVVVSLMLLGSVAVAHFVTPLVCVWLHERSGRGAAGRAGGEVARPAARVAGWLTRRYERGLRGAIAHPIWLLAVFASALSVSFVAVGAFLWPPAFFGAADRHQFLVELRLASSAPVSQTAEVAEQVGRWLDTHPDVADWTSFAGSEAPKFYYNEFPSGRQENRGMIVVNTVAGLAFEQTRGVVDALNERFARRIPGSWIRARVLSQGYGADADVQIFVQGDDLNALRRLSQEIATLARTVPGVIDVEDSFGYESVTLAARVREARAEALGIGHREIADALRIALDGVRTSSVPEGDEEIPIVIRLAESQRRHAGDLRNLLIFSPRAGRSVPLAQLAHIEADFAERTLLRFDRQHEGSIAIDVEGRPVASVTSEIEARVAEELAIPDDLRLHYYGERKEANESFLSLARAALVAILLIYTILVVRFQSLLQPLLVVLAIPMALIGSIWGLVITGMPLGLTAFLGMIALTGIVVNDSIVLLDYINTLRDRGADLETAIRVGTRTRLRPVLMTSITTIAGLLPLATGGGSFWGPFGFAMIFGLAASTGLTLVIQPASYGLLERARTRRRTKRGAGDPCAALPDSGMPAC